MFFFIGGIQPKTVFVDRNPKPCSSCGHVKLYLKRVDHFLSLFFIPLFAVKRGIPFLVCENCGSVFDEKGLRMTFSEESKCPRCGRPVAPDFSFCPYCGKAL